MYYEAHTSTTALTADRVSVFSLVRMIGLEPTLPCGNWNLNSLDGLAGGGAPRRINGLRRFRLVRNGLDGRQICFGFALRSAIPGVIGPFQRPTGPSSPAQRIPSIVSPDLTPKHRGRFGAATPNTPPARTGTHSALLLRPVDSRHPGDAHGVHSALFAVPPRLIFAAAERIAARNSLSAWSRSWHSARSTETTVAYFLEE